MEALEIRGNKTTRDLLREATWFILHTLIAIAILLLVITAFTLARPDPDAGMPKLLCTGAAFLVPLVGGFFTGRVRRNTVAGYVWISGLITFAIMCVYVLDLPTGAGLCDGCGAVSKLWRTFFSIDNGSGLIAGNGIFAGTWIPLSTIGYAVGVKVAKSVD